MLKRFIYFLKLKRLRKLRKTFEVLRAEQHRLLFQPFGMLISNEEIDEMKKSYSEIKRLEVELKAFYGEIPLYEELRRIV